jgi:hypothetical protein
MSALFGDVQLAVGGVIARRLHLGRIDGGEIDRVLPGHAGDGAREARGIVELERAGSAGKGHAAGEGGGNLERLSRLHGLQLRLRAQCSAPL